MTKIHQGDLVRVVEMRGCTADVRHDRVWYWARRRGERAHKKRGIITSSDGTYARVRLFGDHPVPVQLVEVKRLRREDE